MSSIVLLLQSLYNESLNFWFFLRKSVISNRFAWHVLPFSFKFSHWFVWAYFIVHWFFDGNLRFHIVFIWFQFSIFWFGCPFQRSSFKIIKFFPYCDRIMKLLAFQARLFLRFLALFPFLMPPSLSYTSILNVCAFIIRFYRNCCDAQSYSHFNCNFFINCLSYP